MEIFIAWSGTASHILAEALFKWLPFVIPDAKPFMSSESIRKGQRWFSEIGARLEKTNFAILCVTPQNVKSTWMHFEAGAVSKNTTKGYVSALLLDTAGADLELPLSQFQHTPANKVEILKLLLAIDEALGAERRGETHVKTLFEKFWPELDGALKEARAALSTVVSKDPTPKRSDREILEGILDTQQGIVKRIASLETQLGGVAALAALANTNPPDSATLFGLGRVNSPLAAAARAPAGGLMGALSEHGEYARKLTDALLNPQTVFASMPAALELKATQPLRSQRSSG